MLKSKKTLISVVLCLTMLMATFSVTAIFPTVAFAASHDWKTIFANADSWFGSANGIALADEIIANQLSDGGWRKDYAATSGEWAKSTIDNDATTSEIKALAKTYKQTGTAKYLTACQEGIDRLISGQYSNGGWPQIFGATSGTYHLHITYNDDAMIKVLNLLTSVANKTGDYTFVDSTRAANASTAVTKGIQCILNTQITNNGVKTIWGQQHDETTLLPTSARAYELPSACSKESVGIINYLKTISNPSDAIKNAINSAVAYLTKVQINGIKTSAVYDSTGTLIDVVVVSDPTAPPIWTRFYELGTDKPVFFDRDSSTHYALSEISQERRTGYSWYGTWPSSVVTAGYVTPAAPKSLTAIAGNAQVSLTWSASTGASSYSVKRATTSGGSYTTVKTGLTSTSYTDTGLTNGTKYYYVVVAVNPAGTSANSNEANATPTVPTLISDLVVNDTTNAADWSIQSNIQVGSVEYGDRTYTIAALPSTYAGSAWVRAANDSKAYTGTTLVSFKVNAAATVYVAFDDRVTTKPSWLSGWTDIGNNIVDNQSTPVTYSVFSKMFASGSTVSLGPNGQSATCCQYYIIVK